MYLLRLVCCMDSDGLCSMEALGDVVRLALERLGSIGGGRVQEGMSWSVAAEGELVVGDVADGRCLRVEVVEDGEEDPVARGGDDAA